MALKKKVKMPNGLELNYHRIALLTIDTNNGIRLLRYSYLNEDARNIEKVYAKGELDNVDSFPYVYTEYMDFDYEDGMCLKKAYELLKQLPEFKGSEDC